MITLDITDWKQKDDDLRREIVNAVLSTQAVLVQPLPDQLVMTKAQFDMLDTDPRMQAMYQSTERLYVTPHNAMEVVVKQ